MYCGYDLSFLNEGCFADFEDVDSYYKQGLELLNEQRAEVKIVLDDFAIRNGTLDGTAIQENWFPQIEADVFISHSHSDERLAVIFSTLLHDCFGLSTFIDSCIWGYSTKLLKLIDNKYCKNIDEDTYNYTKRNFSTSHVYMMLSTALMMMVDNCECIFFLDTPNAVNTKDVIQRTQSPWIYSEINISRLIKKRRPERMRNIHDSLIKSQGSTYSENFSLNVEYELNTSHFSSLSLDDFDRWKKNYDKVKGNSLDVLYKMIPPENTGVVYG
jgi:hypothetical protein